MNFKPFTSFYSDNGQFLKDLVGKPKTGFLATRVRIDKLFVGFTSKSSIFRSSQVFSFHELDRAASGG